MRHFILAFVLCFLSITFLCAQFTEINLEENYISEGKFYKKNNTLYTDRIVVKFNKAILNLDENNKNSKRQAIPSLHANVNKLLDDLANKYGEMDLIKKIPSADPNDLQRTNKRTGEIVTIADMSQLYTIKFPNPVPLKSTVKSFEDLSEVDYAHQPITIKTLDSPNDTLYQMGEQWNLDAVNAEGAWDVTHGHPSISIAIIDDGSSNTHEDLSSKIERFDGIVGYHGTAVSGVAGAATNNITGIASLGWETKLHTYGGDKVDDIYLAVQKGADIINMSWLTVTFLTENDIEEIMPYCPRPDKWDGSAVPFSYPEVEQAIEDAAAQGVILIAAAGNSAGNDGPNPELCNPWIIPYNAYPAAYDEVIAVSATRMVSGTERFVEFFNYGNYMDFSAPGYQILSTSINPDYAYEIFSGTSFSSPLTAALVSLILAQDPYEDIYEIIKETADKIDNNHPYDGNGWNQYLGYGRIDAKGALNAVFPAKPTNLYITGSVGQNPTLYWDANSEDDLNGYKIYQKIDNGPTSLLITVGSGITSFTDNGVIIGNSKFDPTVTYWVSAYDLAGNESVKSNPAWVKAGGISKQSTDQLITEENDIPKEFQLYPAYPNPFNPTITFNFDLAKESVVNIKIYNQIGNLIWETVSQNMQAGSYSQSWGGINLNGIKVSTGIYYVVLNTGSQIFNQKILLLK